MSTRGHHGVLLGSGGPWTPAALGVSQWLNDDSSVTDAGSGACSQWNDIGGNAWHFTQATGSKRPTITPSGLNSRRVIAFDGGDIMGAAGATGLFRNVASGYLFGVYRLGVTDGAPAQRAFYWFSRSGSTTSRLVLGAGESSGAANAPYFGGRRLDTDSFSGAISSTGRPVQWVMALGVCDFTNRQISLYINGALDASVSGAWTAGGNTSNTASQGVSLGGTLSEAAFFQGSIAEVFAGVGIPSSDSIDKTFGYAAHRWGLASLLDVSHPYKSAPPTL